ncbi:MAG: lipocalin family protein [Sulfurimonas sp.]
MRYLWLPVLFFLAGCVEIPKNVKPVEDFELKRYLGTWYEIARLDHSFERGLERITATYTIREDNGVKVINRGFNIEKKHGIRLKEKPILWKVPMSATLRSLSSGPSTAPTS